jgi:hypothetical protein
MTTKTAAATKTHRVFDAINGLYPVTFANVREADPAALLDIFEGSDSTRDAYFEATFNAGRFWPEVAATAGCDWADYLRGFDTDHDDECELLEAAGEWDCHCKIDQYENNHQWGRDLWEAIQQRIQELND